VTIRIICNTCAQEDPWNAIGAGALTGGFLQLRSGFKSAAKSAAFGGILLVNGGNNFARTARLHRIETAPVYLSDDIDMISSSA
jgi:hypothetical protein